DGYAAGIVGAHSLSLAVPHRLAVAHLGGFEAKSLAAGSLPGPTALIGDRRLARVIGYLRNDAQLFRIALTCRARELINHPAGHIEDRRMPSRLGQREVIDGTMRRQHDPSRLGAGLVYGAEVYPPNRHHRHDAASGSTQHCARIPLFAQARPTEPVRPSLSNRACPTEPVQPSPGPTLKGRNRSSQKNPSRPRVPRAKPPPPQGPTGARALDRSYAVGSSCCRCLTGVPDEETCLRVQRHRIDFARLRERPVCRLLSRPGGQPLSIFCANPVLSWLARRARLARPLARAFWLAWPALLVCSALGAPTLLRDRHCRSGPRHAHHRRSHRRRAPTSSSQPLLVLGRSLRQSRLLGLLLLGSPSQRACAARANSVGHVMGTCSRSHVPNP